MTEDFYDLLEIPSDASQDEIKDAYRKQVRVYHPDLNDDDRARAQFTAVKKAYDILGDPVERQAYDRLGHETYVAKRTSGLPSADVWRSDDSSTDSDQSSANSDEQIDRTRDSTGGSSRSRSTTSSRSKSASSSSRSTTSSRSGSTSSSSRSAGSTSQSTTQTSASQTSAGSTTSKTATNGGTATAGNQGMGSTSGATTHGPTGSAQSSTGGRFEDNALVAWWRRQNFAWPLIWLSALTYLAGLGHYASENAEAIGTLLAEVTAIGAQPGPLWEAVSTQRHGIQSPIEFVGGLVSTGGLVTPPVEQTQWYGVLAGLVGVALGVVVLTRVAWRSETWGRVTIDETILMALAVGVTTTLLGGPLLAGAVLMPMLFGVIVYRTRQLPGWSPSLLYVLAVTVPAVALVAGIAGVGIDSLPIEFVVFALVPLCGAFGLPLRVQIRKRFGR